MVRKGSVSCVYLLHMISISTPSMHILPPTTGTRKRAQKPRMWLLASVVMQRQSYPTETVFFRVLSKKVTKNRM